MCQDGSISQVRSSTGRTTILSSVPLRVRLLERYGHGNINTRPVVNKWIYVFYDDGAGNTALEAEIFAQENGWNISRRPDISKTCIERATDPNRIFTDMYIELDLSFGYRPKGYFFMLSPIQLTENSIRNIISHNRSYQRKRIPNDFDFNSILEFSERDPFEEARSIHSVYINRLRAWEDWTTNHDRQSKLFIASTLKSWIGDSDPASIRSKLADGQPEKYLREYEDEEKRIRTRAERMMRSLIRRMESTAYKAIEKSCQEGMAEQRPESLATGLLQWGNVSDSMLAVLPGRIFAYKVVDDNNYIPSSDLFTEENHFPPDVIYESFSGAWDAAVDTVTELLPAIIKKIRESAEEGRYSNQELVMKYLDNLSVQTELRGTYRFIHERGGRTSGLSGSRRGRVNRSYQRLVRRASTTLPNYNAEAQIKLDAAGRYERMQRTSELPMKRIQLLLSVVNLTLAIDDYRTSFSDARSKKLLTHVNFALDLADFMISTTEDFRDAKTLMGRSLGTVGAACGFTSGIIDMLDHTEQGVNSWMQNHDYDAAIGQAVSAVGASLAAFAGAWGIVDSITAGAIAGSELGPWGTLAGVIGGVLMAAGGILVWWLTDNEYELYAKHCTFTEDPTIEVMYPQYSNHGGLSPRTSLPNQANILIDLLAKFTASFVATTRTIAALPENIVKGRGFKLTINPGYFSEGVDHFKINISVTHGSERVLTEENLIIPNNSTQINIDNGRIKELIHEWSREELGLVENFHRITMRFSYTIALVSIHGQQLIAQGLVGGETRNAWGQYEWNNVEF